MEYLAKIRDFDGLNRAKTGVKGVLERFRRVRQGIFEGRTKYFENFDPKVG